jgi:hypothetical protein
MAEVFVDVRWQRCSLMKATQPTNSRAERWATPRFGRRRVTATELPCVIASMTGKIMSNRPRTQRMSTKRILFLAPLVILMLCVTQRFASAQRNVVHGECGAANGVAVSAAPSTNLCASGTASAVEGSGPWSWKCNSSRGGSSASCSAPVESVGGATTAAGVPLPTGWALRQFDTFSTDGNITNYTQLHAEYCESLFFNVDSSGCLVRLPNVVINNEQETYEHFETSIVFFTDHLEIQGRGQPNGVTPVC